jgi:peptide/nickel transport system substrate-binding protein
VQVQGLMSGAIDAVEFVDVEDIKILQASADVQVNKSLSALILVMSINCSNPILSNPKVRQAVTMAIDKQKVLDAAYGGGVVIGTFMDAANGYYQDFTKLYPYNPARAKALLAEAQIPADASFELVLPSNYDMHVKAGQMYQEMLSKVRLNVKIKLVDWPTWIKDVYTDAKYDFTVTGHTGKLDPDGTLGNYGIAAKRYVRWENPEASGLIVKAAAVADVAARKALYAKALEIMAREVPFMYLGTSYVYRGFRKNVSEYRLTPKLDTFDFRWTEVK